MCYLNSIMKVDKFGHEPITMEVNSQREFNKIKILY